MRRAKMKELAQLEAMLRTFSIVLALAACGDDSGVMDGGGLDATPSDAPRSDAPAEPDAPTADGGTSTSDGGETATTIRIVYPDGERIALRGAGGGLDWESGADTTAMGGGLYVYTTTEITEPVEWKPLLDDATWARGPNYHVEPGQTIEIAPRFSAMSGRLVELLAAWSPAALGNTRRVFAYLPPAHDENTVARFPVVYMHDGQNLFDPSSAFGGNEWEVDETVDRAAESGRCADGSACTNDGECGGARCDTFREAIVIGVSNSAARIDEYTPTVDASYGGGRGDDYLAALADDLRPTVGAMLRVHTGREDTAIVGSSLGGLISAHAGVTRPEVFGLVGAMSPSTWWDERVILDEVATIPSRPVRALRVYVDSGDGGASSDGAADTADLARTYEATGYVEGDDFHYVLAPGHEHNETWWRVRLPGALAFLLGPRERITEAE
jgi:predicted alpha/beta superfamily hydrolase